MDYTRNTMRAAIKSLEAVITPAVETTGQAHAIEQVHLVTDFLRFAEQRIHLIGDREKQQLIRAINLATALVPLLDETEVQSLLQGAKQAAERVIADPQHDSESVRRGTAELERAIRRCICATDNLDRERRQAVERAALQASLAQAAADRVWLQPLGFDPAPDSLPDIQEALAGPAAAGP